MQTLQSKIEQARNILLEVESLCNNKNAILHLQLSVNYAELALKEME